MTIGVQFLCIGCFFHGYRQFCFEVDTGQSGNTRRTGKPHDPVLIGNNFLADAKGGMLSYAACVLSVKTQKAGYRVCSDSPSFSAASYFRPPDPGFLTSVLAGQPQTEAASLTKDQEFAMLRTSIS